MMAVIKGVTSRQAGEGEESTAPSGTGIMSSGFQYPTQSAEKRQLECALALAY